MKCSLLVCRIQKVSKIEEYFLVFISKQNGEKLSLLQYALFSLNMDNTASVTVSERYASQSLKVANEPGGGFAFPSVTPSPEGTPRIW